MKIRPVLHLISYMLAVIGLSMGLSLAVSLACRDPEEATFGLAAGFGGTLAFAAVLWLLTRCEIDLSRRDGLGVAAFGWIAASLFGAIPFVVSGIIPDPVPAMFETMSGFSTTGASVLRDIEPVPKGILFWRAMTHFFGGMGVLVLCVAILPFLRVGGVQIYRAETPGPSKDRLTPRIAETAKLLWGAYVLLCVIETVLLGLGGMNLLEAWCHACATMATGGFSTRTASVGAFESVYIDTIIVIFMFLAGTNFVLHLKLLAGKPFEYFKDAEFRFYLGVWVLACALLTFDIWGPVYSSFWQALRAGCFQATSVLTTTGFITSDFDLWPQTSRMLLVLLMFFGGCAGSTGGSLKIIRILTALRTLFREVHLYMQPLAVRKVKIGGENVSEEAVSNIMAFVLIFILVFAGGSLVMTFFTPDLATAATSTIACLGNIGPGLAGVGAMKNYADIPDAGLAFLSFLMLLGRLELYTVLVVFLPAFWKR